MIRDTVKRAVLCLLCALCCLGWLGCSDPEPGEAEPAVDPSAAAAERAARRADPALVTLLEDAGAELTRSDPGDIVAIDLRKAEFSGALLEAVCKVSSLHQLVAVDSDFDDDDAVALAAAAPPLFLLDLRGCPISDTGLTALAGIGSLRALKLSGQNGRTTVTDAGFAAFEEHPSLKALTADGLWIGSPAISTLVTIPGIEELYLADTLVDDGALAMIASLPNLRKLRLARTQISDDGLASLAECRSLLELDLSENTQFTDACGTSLGQITSLTKLNLWRVPLTDDGVIELAPLTNLKWLNLDNTALSDAGLVALKDMTELEFLHLGSTQITDDGLPALQHLNSLQDLKVTRTAVTEAGADALQEHLPEVEIQLVYVEGQ